MIQTTAETISSVEQLNAIREATRRKQQQPGKTQILVCMGGGCIASGAREVMTGLQTMVRRQKVDDRVDVIATGCLGPCVCGPVVLMGKDRVFYQNVQPSDAEAIIRDHALGGQVVRALTWKHGPQDEDRPTLEEIPFFQHQTKIVLRNCGAMDPTDLLDAIAHDAYQGLGQVLTSMTPEQILGELEVSGLRGRGGAGFPTWRKWTFTRQAPGEIKYILCNGDEGDPGAFMDRSILEGDPHAVIEGMAIGAYTIGARQGYVYVRAEYPLAVERLQQAIDDARQAGLLGREILGTDFAFDLEIRMGSGAFVCGEETALIASVEGRRGEPRPRPPFPAQQGLWDAPTVLNNVETYANVPMIVRKGGEWFAKYGTESSKGTKVFALAGAIRISGLVEVPIGTTLRELIYDVGGGIPGDKAFKAAQIGGPSGGCIPSEHLDIPLDYESLNKLDAIMGSGGLVVMDEDTCMVDVARFFLEFMQEESCGKCIPCRLGIRRMLDILNRICDGLGQSEDLQELDVLGRQIKMIALCGLGKTSPNPVLSTLRFFRDEYEAHINDKRCPAGVCTKLIRYRIDPEACIGCTACVKKCPVDAITGQKKEPHVIDIERCIRCGACVVACKFDAVLKE